MKNDRRWMHEAASAFEQDPQSADAHAQRLLKMPTAGLLAICEVAADLQRGEKIGRAHIDAMQKVYSAVPRYMLEQYARELNAVRDPAGRVRQFLFRVAGSDAPRYHAVLEDFQRRMTAEQVSERAAERDSAGRARYDTIRAKQAPEERARSDARLRDRAGQREIISKLVNANPAHREPNLIEHGNRLDAGAKMLYRSGVGDRSVSLRDSIAAAYDSHSAIDAGKEAGLFPESVGVGDVGAEAPSASAILEGDA